jgi:hypothetical protein
VTYAQERRRLGTVIRRLKRAETAGAPLARLRLLQKSEGSLLAIAAVLREDIRSLTGEILGTRGPA